MHARAGWLQWVGQAVATRVVQAGRRHITQKLLHRKIRDISCRESSIRMQHRQHQEAKQHQEQQADQQEQTDQQEQADQRVQAVQQVQAD